MSARPLRNLALLAASLLLALLLVEIGLRAADFSAPSFYTRDPLRGGVLRPGARGLWTREGRDFVVINSRGLRDREHALVKPPGTLRVAVLGDSYAEATQLPMEKAFWAVLERELAGCASLAGRPVEVVNFGVSGYGTAQELLALRHAAWDYSPDVVVLAFVTGNDVRNTVVFPHPLCAPAMTMPLIEAPFSEIPQVEPKFGFIEIAFKIPPTPFGKGGGGGFPGNREMRRNLHWLALAMISRALSVKSSG